VQHANYPTTISGTVDTDDVTIWTDPARFENRTGPDSTLALFVAALIPRDDPTAIGRIQEWFHSVPWSWIGSMTLEPLTLPGELAEWPSKVGDQDGWLAVRIVLLLPPDENGESIDDVYDWLVTRLPAGCRARLVDHDIA
jgi:hypothetical protein